MAVFQCAIIKDARAQFRHQHQKLRAPCTELLAEFRGPAHNARAQRTKKGDVFPIHEKTNWRYLLPLILMEGHKASLKNKDKIIEEKEHLIFDSQRVLLDEQEKSDKISVCSKRYTKNKL